jgi:hypothetical protein
VKVDKSYYEADPGCMALPMSMHPVWLALILPLRDARKRLYNAFWPHQAPAFPTRGNEAVAIFRPALSSPSLIKKNPLVVANQWLRSQSESIFLLRNGAPTLFAGNARMRDDENPRRHHRFLFFFFYPRDLELFPFRLNRNGSLGFCFNAFSSREPVSTSLENALTSRGAQTFAAFYFTTTFVPTWTRL